jgi:Tetratricopeptide repeat
VKDLGRCEQAEGTHRQVLRLQEAVLRKEHPDSSGKRAGGRDELTSVRAGRDGAGQRPSWHTDEYGQFGVNTVLESKIWDESKNLERRVMETRTTLLGHQHPDL